MGHWSVPRRSRRKILLALKAAIVTFAAAVFVSSIVTTFSERRRGEGRHLLSQVGSEGARRMGDSQGLQDIDVVYIDIQSLQRPKQRRKNVISTNPNGVRNQHILKERQQRRNPTFQLQSWATPDSSFQGEAHRLRSYINTPQVNCSIMYSSGTENQNGAWKLCFDQHYFSTPEECIVYSFMVEKNNFNFEEDLSERGCEVHLFNPGMKPKKLSSDKLQAHSVNLDWKESSVRGVGDITMTSRRLSSIMQELGHSEVDIVRMDIESSEWKVLENILIDRTVLNIRQLIIKIHMMWAGYEVSGSEAEVVRYWFSLLKFLERSGFRLFSTVEDTASPFKFMGQNITNLRCCYTLSWVNTQDIYHNIS